MFSNVSGIVRIEFEPRRTFTPCMMSTVVCGAIVCMLSRTCAVLVFAIANDGVAGIRIP